MIASISSMATSAKGLLDVGARSHYTDAQMAKYVVEGLRRLYSVRPSSRMALNGIADPAFPEDDDELLAFSVNINEARWVRGVVYYAAALAHEVGISDSVNLQLAQTLKKQADEIFTA